MMAYGTSTVKRRRRRTKAEITALCDAIMEVLEDDHPQSVRHVFYRLVEHPYALVPKTEAGYRTVQRKLLDLRRDDEVPWGWVSDGTRWRRQSQSFGSMAEAVEFVAETYRRDLWRRTPVYVEIWTESDSIAGTIIDEVYRYSAPLMVSRGFSSDSYLYSAAQAISEENRPAHLYYIGDWDPSGKIIPQVIERRLRAFAPEAEIHFERLLVTQEQIREWKLPTKPAKKTTHARGFRGGTVEAEAIPANVTRRLVREAIEQHLDLNETRVMREAEKSEADHLLNIAEALEYADPDDIAGALEEI